MATATYQHKSVNGVRPHGTPPYFRMRVVSLLSALTVRTDGSSFVAGFVLSGATDIAACGESFLIPAATGEVRIRPTAPNTRVILTEL